MTGLTINPSTTSQAVNGPDRPNKIVSTNRVVSIDILRAVTMVLMIFVNDLWSLSGIPAWLGHVDNGVDGIGLADTIFPAFLFIVGLSLPYSIDSRRTKGETDFQLLQHVLWRTIALLVMGVFLVNGENINSSETGIHRLVWNTVCCLCFIIVWNTYPVSMRGGVVAILRGAALGTLITLAILYRGGNQEPLERFGPQWWGILGLIGWAYLVSASVAVLARNHLTTVILAWLFFSCLSILHHAKLIPDYLYFIPMPVLGGTLTALTLGGVATSIVFKHYHDRNEPRKLTLVLASTAIILAGLALITRPYWGLAKLGETPAWLFLCSALTLLAFLAVYWIADVYSRHKWFSIIKPAGTATLLCYLIPYFAYATTAAFGIHLPAFMLIGPVGLLKSFLFALLCAWITGVLVRLGIRFRV